MAQPWFEVFNAAEEILRPNLVEGRRDRIAFVDDDGSYTYGELASRVDQFSSALRANGFEPEHRILLVLSDTIDFPTAFLGAIKAGLVPIPVNTLLTADDYDYMLADSRARMLVISDDVLGRIEGVIEKHPMLRKVVVSGPEAGRHTEFRDFLFSARSTYAVAPTRADEPCFWLYSSGSTGAPKGTVHIHSSPALTAELYAKSIWGVRQDDVIFSASKLFFAYGLGNGMTFPLSAGASAVLLRERPTPEAVFRVLREQQPTIFCAVPTLYAALLSADDFPDPNELNLRLCVSAGEALPKQIGEAWKERTGIDILDGLGSTEMLHIFISNRCGDVAYGTTGRPVPGYELRLLDDEGVPVPSGEIGELHVKGPTAAAYYWNNRAKSRETFLGSWTRTGDKYLEDENGRFVYCGRRDDMLKVGGIYVSPFEVESAIVSHDDVLEAAVVGEEDDSGLVKPKAFVVAKSRNADAAELEEALRAHVRDRLAPFKCPRQFVLVASLPKTATGKIQRFKLRAGETA